MLSNYPGQPQLLYTSSTQLPVVQRVILLFMLNCYSPYSPNSYCVIFLCYETSCIFINFLINEYVMSCHVTCNWLLGNTTSYSTTDKTAWPTCPRTDEWDARWTVQESFDAVWTQLVTSLSTLSPLKFHRQLRHMHAALSVNTTSNVLPMHSVFQALTRQQHQYHQYTYRVDQK